LSACRHDGLRVRGPEPGQRANLRTYKDEDIPLGAGPSGQHRRLRPDVPAPARSCGPWLHQAQITLADAVAIAERQLGGIPVRARLAYDGHDHYYEVRMLLRDHLTAVVIDVERGGVLRTQPVLSRVARRSQLTAQQHRKPPGAIHT
jgi:hypothetical protein